MIMNQQHICEKLCLNQLQNESTKQNKENFQSNLNDVMKFFLLYEIQILENRIFALANYEISDNFSEERQKFKLALSTLLLDSKENDLAKQKQLISLIKQFCGNQVNEDQINEIIQQWLSLRLAPIQIQQFLEYYSLNSIIQIPEMLDTVAEVIYHQNNLNQYDFYNSFIQNVINKNLVPHKKDRGFAELENILQNMEIYAIILINNQQNTQIQEKIIYYQEPWIESLLKHKQIIDFLVARHFDEQLSKISENSITDLKFEREVFIAIRDESKLGTINFSTNNLFGVMNYLREKYEQKEYYKERLIKMVQASAKINNFEQEAGNAMSVLSSLKAIIRNENFSKINLKNSTMNNIQFFESNFNDSNMSNVSIVSAQFIQCQIQNVCWSNLQSSDLIILKGIETIFSSHNSILISMSSHFKFNLSFYNLHTSKQIKILYKQSNICDYGKFRLKLSCQGQILVFNDKEEGNFVSWSIQSLKKIRVNKRNLKEGKKVLSHDCQMLARISGHNQISLWNIYNVQQNLQFQVQASIIYEMKFSKNNLILILIISGREYIFLDVKSRLETILKEGQQYKLSPDGQFYTIRYFYPLALIIKSLDNKTNLQIQESFLVDHIYNLKFSPNGKILAFQNNKSVILWGRDDQKVLQTQDYKIKSFEQFSELRQKTSLIKFTPDGQSLVIKYKDNIVLWKFNEGKQFSRIDGNLTEINKIRFSQNGQSFILLQFDTQRLGNVKNLLFSNLSVTQFPQTLDTVFFSSTTSHLAFIYGHKDYLSKTIKIKILNDFKLTAEVNLDKDSDFSQCALSSDLKTIAYFCKDSVQVEKIKGGQKYHFQTLKLLDVNGEMTHKKQIKFSPDGEYLIILVQKYHISKKIHYWTFQIWKINNSILIYEMELTNERNYYIGSFEFSQNSQCVTVPYCHNTQIFNIKQKQFKDLRFEKNHISSTNAFSLDGKFLASNFHPDNFSYEVPNAQIRIWNIEEEKIIQRIEGNFFSIHKIIFLNEHIVISGSANYECIIQIWKWQDGIKIQGLNLHKFGIDNISISPDRSMMVSKDFKGTVYLWKNIGTKNKVSNQLQIFNQEQEYFFVPHSIISNPIFRSVNCSLENSQFSSTEGFNLQSIFSDEK